MEAVGGLASALPQRRDSRNLRPLSPMPVSPPLIAHVIYRLGVGGLENGLVNLINHLPVADFRHSIVCLTDYTDFRNRIERPDVEVHALHKPPGNGLGTHARLWRLFRTLSPAIVHTRNIAALEYQPVAMFAGIPARVHSEHGRDVEDLKVKHRRYTAIRRALRPVVHQTIALSRDLERYLREDVQVPADRLSQVYNGVDTGRFRPAGAVRRGELFEGLVRPGDIVFGTVGRMEAIKDPLNLARAFVLLCGMFPDIRQRLRLVMVGDGSLREAVGRTLGDAGLSGQVFLPGSRDDIDSILPALDVFVLPSLSEGISNTILEAMSCGLPVVATRTGGNPELVVEGETGALVPTASPDRLAEALAEYVRRPDLARLQGEHARARAVAHFSISAMTERYASIYRSLIDDRVRGMPRPAAGALRAGSGH